MAEPQTRRVERRLAQGRAVLHVQVNLLMAARLSGAAPPVRYSLVAGSLYLALGVSGFVWTGSGRGTGMMNDMLFGVFMVNPSHNVVHLAVGLLWLLGAFVLTAAGAEGVNLALGIFWALATVLGFLGYLSALAVSSGTTADEVRAGKVDQFDGVRAGDVRVGGLVGVCRAPAPGAAR